MMPKIATLSQIPPIAERRIALRVTPPAERAIRDGHPWLFADSITRQSHEGSAGDLAVVFNRKGKFMAIGLYDPDSAIRVRILHQGKPVTIDDVWFQERLTAALNIRRPLEESRTDGYRLVHGENDGLPGLIIDRYASVYVIKLYTAAWIPHLRTVLDTLRLVGPKSKVAAQRVILRLSRMVQAQKEALHGLEEGALLAGPVFDGRSPFQENGIQFEADVLHGQKTGFFLDQRDNRAMVEGLANGRSVLNLFAYTGGFSLYAARGGATKVVSVDSSRPALETAVSHFQLNGHNAAIAAATHAIIVGDVFDVLRDMEQQGMQFGMVIIDPPSFAKKKSERDAALRAYERLIVMGLAVLRSGGVLVAASCSSQILADEFFALVHKVGMKNGRYLQEINRTTHAIDHPIGYPEGAYLKCLFATAP